MDTEKTFEKVQCSVMVRTFNKVSIKGAYINIIKAMYGKPTVTYVLDSEKLKAFPLRSGTRKGCPFSPLLFSIVLEDIEQLSKKKK